MIHRHVVLIGATPSCGIQQFTSALANSGETDFDVTSPSVEGAFVRIYAIKNAKEPDPKLVLPFRGAS